MPVEIAQGVWRIPTLGSAAVNSFAFVDDDGTVTLVDAGLSRRRLVASLSEIGKRPTDVSRIVLTHAHPDHCGGAAGLRDHTGALVHVHQDDAAYLRSGKRPPADPAQPLGKLIDLVSRRQAPCPADRTFLDGDLVGGLQVLHTPGHTPGHCSFLHQRSGVLIVGDALCNLGAISYPRRFLCTNVELSRESAKRLGEVSYEVAAFAHGPEAGREAVRAVTVSGAPWPPPSRAHR